jgi:hypothetical protein
MQGAIIEHTQHVANELAARCLGDPATELAAWIRMAEQREAMVVALYDGDALERRLPPASSAEVQQVVMKAVGSIWAQETSHARLLGSLRTVADERAPHVEAIMGAIEGATTDRATNSGVTGAIARWLIGLGRAIGAAPEFTKELGALRFDGFCRFSNELEQTAAHGYARMVELIDQIEGAHPDIRFGLWTRYEVAKTLAEERLHAAVFDRIITWLAADGSRIIARDARRCVGELRDLADAYLGMASIRELPAEISRPKSRGFESFTGDASAASWVSDGGLGDLFRAYSFDTPLADERAWKASLTSEAIASGGAPR